MNIHDDFERRCQPNSGGHPDMRPHMHQLRNLARRCVTACEFGTRTGNSTAALLSGLAECGGLRLTSYDANRPDCDFPDTGVVKWEFIQQNTADPNFYIPTCDLLFVDTLHTGDQVRAELRHANRVNLYLVFHDVVMFGWNGEGGDGILPAIFDFMAERPAWRVHAFHPSQWGMLVLRRTP